MPTIDFNNPIMSAKFTRPELLQHPQIPSPLAQVSPRNIKGQAWWDKQRTKAYRKNNWHCWACGAGDTVLHAHEVYEINYFRRRSVFLEVTALCEDCHNFIHIGRYGRLLHRRKIKQKDFRRVVEHGCSVLSEAGLKANSGLRYVLSSLMSAYVIKRNKWMVPIMDCCEYKTIPLIDEDDWPRWRLIFEGKAYPPKFNSYTEYQEEYT